MPRYREKKQVSVFCAFKLTYGMHVKGWSLLKTVTVGVNGFWRIGRCALAHITESGRNDIEVVKLNVTGSTKTSAHLLRYDSIHGRFPLGNTVNANSITLGRGPIDVMSHMFMVSWIGVIVTSFSNVLVRSIMEGNLLYI